MSCIEQATPSDTSGPTSIQEVEQLSALLENLIQELHAPVTRQKLDQLNERYCILARDGRVDAAGELQLSVARLNARWRDQSDRLSSLLHAVRDASSLIHHWQVINGKLVLFEIQNLILTELSNLFNRDCETDFWFGVHTVKFRCNRSRTMP
jgi:hypothetical protein